MKKEENYLEKIPVRGDFEWKTDDDGVVTLEIVNKGVFNTIAQKLLKKPRVSYIHLDKMGSFIWPIIDGEKSILDISEAVDKEFGEEAKPLYERLAKYFQILASYGFVTFKE